MRHLPVIFCTILLSALFFSACEVENCPPNALAFAKFNFVDQYGREVEYQDTITVIGQLETGDTLINDTLINKETNVSTLSLPLSYGEETRFIVKYNRQGQDRIVIRHRNIPYFINLDCGTMMFYEVLEATSTNRIMDSIVTTNPNIDNNEKENFKLYFTTADTE